MNNSLIKIIGLRLLQAGLLAASAILAYKDVQGWGYFLFLLALTLWYEAEPKRS